MTELTFKGKEFVYNHHLSVPFCPLVPHAEKGIGEVDLGGNLIVQGDNLHALKSLLPRYAGKVDCIFIDPPYNTGNEGWAYNDNVSAPMIKEWLAANPIGIEDGLRHDKWCAMMWPRLRLLHDLLAEDGSLWMTLDDNESHRAKLMLDEIFGEEGFAANIVWNKKYATPNDQTGIAPMHDNLFVYCKNEWQRNLLDRTQSNDIQYRHSDDRGVFRIDNYTCNKNADERPNLFYPVVNPNTGEEIWPNRNAVWRYSKERHQENINNNLVWWGKDGKSLVPAFKRFRHMLRTGGGTVPGTWWTHNFAGHTDEARKRLRELLPELDGQDATITPKPVTLITRVLQIATQKDSLVLDSFAGSGATAHAVLEANKRDGGNRKFILVEMEDYADRLTAERVRRVINGYDFTGTQKTELLRENLNWRTIEQPNSLVDRVQGIENLYGHQFDKIKKEIKEGELVVTGEKSYAERTDGLGGTFTYCTLGDPIELDAILTGESLPSYEALGSVLYHTATNHTLDGSTFNESEFYLGLNGDRHVWLIYRADLEWLKGPDAALTLNFARRIAAAHPDQDHLVFAASRFVSDKLLKEEGLRVEFIPLPFALYRIERT
ncbi:site-specific DNA-methyltransferase [Phyllobacterium sp. OV277]|uniref:site-specific DNA-methyltransferase n=1 Tax=Phyllobacterium sp. OV277 TaxID=1882772 RepID=UPI00088BF251|nr:site-specific DNA-methyltransferase [Phyllobacterium sp. OV277]SDO57258.1 adenine-specific DNA-methyltransferase [Phyllobacterium sp. OV277]